MRAGDGIGRQDSGSATKVEELERSCNLAAGPVAYLRQKHLQEAGRAQFGEQERRKNLSKSQAARHTS